jgi:polysaccharide biosynthesis transport protein
MALSPITPRDRLQRLVDLARKTWRYWWLVAVFAVVGAGLSLAFAVTRPRNYMSWTTLFYQERIQSQLLSPNREEMAQRNIGDRYRELLLARKQLDQIINDPKLDPYRQEHDPDVKIEKLRQAVRFTARGAMAFRIEFTDSDPERAKLVTDKLTRLLQETEEAMRNEQAAETVKFATAQKDAAATELKERELKLTEFLAKHPEFVADANSMQTEGASIRASRNNNKPTSSPQLSGKERQLQRIQARLDAPPNAPAVTFVAPPSQERLEALAKVAAAKRELEAAKQALEDQLSKYTEQYPSVIKAKERVENATQALRQAENAVPAEETIVRPPTTAEDRSRLEKELLQLQAEIRAEQSKTGKPSEAQSTTEQRVVQLETENNDLRRDVKEHRDRLTTLTQGWERARQDANQKLAEQGGRLSIVDPAFKPVRPTGQGKMIFLMAGMVLFLSLGLGFAIALAVIDDRLYRRADLDHLGIAVLAVIPPAIQLKRKRERKSKRTKPKDTGGVE